MLLFFTSSVPSFILFSHTSPTSPLRTPPFSFILFFSLFLFYNFHYLYLLIVYLLSPYYSLVLPLTSHFRPLFPNPSLYSCRLHSNHYFFKLCFLFFLTLPSAHCTRSHDRYLLLCFPFYSFYFTPYPYFFRNLIYKRPPFSTLPFYCFLSISFLLFHPLTLHSFSILIPSFPVFSFFRFAHSSIYLISLSHSPSLLLTLLHPPHHPAPSLFICSLCVSSLHYIYLSPLHILQFSSHCYPNFSSLTLFPLLLAPIFFSMISFPSLHLSLISVPFNYRFFASLIPSSSYLHPDLFSPSPSLFLLALPQPYIPMLI